MVKKLMKPVDGSISINRPNVPDNERIDSAKSLAPDSTGTGALYPCLDDFVPHENASGIRAAHVSMRPHRRKSASTDTRPYPTLPSVVDRPREVDQNWSLLHQFLRA
jgi:hypothetical protein